MDGTPITSCSGTIFDSGGSNNGYGANENITTTICPDNTTGTHIQISFSPANIEAGDDLCFYDGPDTGSDLLTCVSDFNGGAFIVQATAANADGCITLEFVSDGSNQGEGWSGIIECVPACQPIIAVLDASDPEVSPVDTGYIDICKGDMVSFSGIGLYPQDGLVYNHSDLNSSFEWNFGDGSTAEGPNTVHTFDEPGGYIVQLTITDIFGCKNINFLNQRVRVSAPPLIEIGDYEAQTCVNDTIELNSVVNNIDPNTTLSITPVDLGFQTGAVISDSLALPDGDGTSYSTSLNFNNFGPGQVLTDINDLLSISINIEHSWMQDLEITLTAPNGTEVILHEFNNNLSEVFLGEPNPSDSDLVFGLGYDYIWTNSNGLTWSEYALVNGLNGESLPGGEYKSYEPLDLFLGTPLNGTWTLTVTDFLPEDNGFIFNWGINFNQNLFPLIETFSIDIVDYTWLDKNIIFFNDGDSISAVPTTAGLENFIFEIEDDFGCIWESNIGIEILPESHPDCFECTELINNFPDTSICVGDTLTIDAGGQNLDFTVPFISNIDYQIGNANHPPSDPYNATINVNSINNTTVNDPVNDIISVCIDFETNFLSDVAFYLQSPNGDVIELTVNNGGSSDFYTNTCFTPTATVAIADGMSPYTGSYQIEGDWNDLIGSPINGVWTLLVSDNSGVSSFGNLNWWSIEFTSGIETEITWSPGDNIDCTDCPQVEFIAADNTDQQLFIEASNSLGCLETDTIQIDIKENVPAPTVTCNNDVAGTVVFSWPQIGNYTDYLININNSGFVLANGNLSHSISGLNNGDLVTAIVMVQETGDECVILETYIECYNCIMTTGVQSILSTSCNGVCDGQAILEVSGGDLPYSFSYLDADGNTILTNSPNISDLCGGPNVLSIIDGANCIDSFNVEIPEPDSVVADFDLTYPPCNGKNTGQIDLTTSGGVGNYSYLWSSGETSQDLENIFSDTYQVSVTDGNDCLFEFEIDLPQPTPIEPNLVVEDVKCFGIYDGSLNFSTTGATPPYLFDINNSDYLGNPSVGGLTPGDYEITIIDDNGCTFDTLVTIYEPDELMINFPSGSNLEINLEEELYLDEEYIEIINNQGLYEVEWLPSFEGTLSCTNCENPIATPFNTISYNVIVRDEKGCIDEETLIINVNKYRVVKVPRGFSPNGDGNNDLLLTHGQNGTVVNTFQVFDRWGTKVFEKTNFEINEKTGWDGKFNGKEMPAGAYLWYANVTYIDGLTERHEGVVNLIR